MCGIVGYTGDREAQELLISSLERLEYRGYDSAGIAIVKEEIEIFKDKGNIAHLKEGMPRIPGTVGIAHTRWATHGAPMKNNSHPFRDCTGRFALVHNGIIENYQEIKDDLMKKGHRFSSETDSEVIVHLIEELYREKGDTEAAVFSAARMLEGSYAILVIEKGSNRIFAIRNRSPLIIGLGDRENFLASDVPAVLEHTQSVIYLQDGDIAVVTPDAVTITDHDGNSVEREPHEIEWTIEDAEKGGYKHFMIKEIFEQPSAIQDSMRGRWVEPADRYNHRGLRSVKIVACGTSYHAGLTGKYILENLLKIPVTVEVASEYRYSPAVRENSTVILITQSGETADTIAAAVEAKRRGGRTIAITNVVGSTITREVDEVIYTQAGPEMGVAATKTFTTQLVALYQLALKYGVESGRLDYDDAKEMERELRLMPQKARAVLDRHDEIKKVAEFLKDSEDMFFIGRNINYPSAMEGALKMKEISYIHAEGYPAGELKHGPLALLTAETPVVAIACRDATFEKMLGNIREVGARESPIIALGFERDRKVLERYADRVIGVPETIPLLSPIPVAIALQLLSYYTADMRGAEIDRPRNLAKSVTVE